MFYIGQKVICVDDIPTHYLLITPETNLPVKDKIYTVREMYSSVRTGEGALLLEEVRNKISPIWNKELGFSSKRFRPVQQSFDFAEQVMKQLNESFSEELLVEEK